MKRIIFYILLLSFTFGCNNQIEEVEEENNIGYEILNEWECEDYLSKEPLVFVQENDTVWCDDAQTNLDLNLCSGFDVCFEMQKLDSLNNIIVDYYDFEIEDLSNLEDLKKDYKKIKANHLESINKCLEYCELEKEKVGISMGDGRERVFHENYRMLHLLKEINIDLQNQVNEINDY